MSAPVSHDPLVVNTLDGSCWRRRAVTREGRGLYALEGTAADAPELVLSTLAELAEHGLASMAHALPMPAGPVVSVVEDASGMTVSFAPGDDPFGLRHDYRVTRDLPEPGGAR